MDLPEGCLVTNLFIPTAVVCTKIDLIEHGEKDIKELLERNLDYIQMTLRKFCLHHGSSLIFTSNNSNSNIKLVYDYMVSRLFDVDFPYASNTADKEALFVPTGLDSIELIEQTADLNQFILKIKKQMEANGEACDEVQYHDVVKKPMKKMVALKEADKEQKVVTDWKSQLEKLYQEKETRQDMINT